MALILVILVLSALLVIGTPFAISMKLQERGSVQTVAEERAQIAAISGRNHAVASLFNTHPSREEGMTVTDSPAGNSGSGMVELAAAKVDDYAELEIRFDTALKITPLEGPVGSGTTPGSGTSEDPDLFVTRGLDGRLIDVQIEDEQGKVNINTAPPNLIGNLFGGSHTGLPE